MDSHKTILLNLAIPLRFLGREKIAINNKLNSLVSQFIPDVDGYLIKWRNLKILDNKGQIIDDQPFVFWKVSFEGHIFEPIEGKILKGKVAKLNNSFLIVKAMESFSVSVTIPEEFKKHPVITGVMLESEIYFRMKSRYRGLLDAECIELSEKIINKQLDDVYAYANEFDY